MYLAAIRLKHIELGHPDPTTAPILKYFVGGIKRIRGSQQHQRLPITIEILRRLKLHLRNTPGYLYQDRRMLWAAFTTAFFGFLRASEFVCPSTSRFDHNTTLMWSDIMLGQSRLKIHIKGSKTDPFRQGHSLLLGASSSSVCPVTAMQKFREVIGTPNLTSPVFTFTDGSFLTRERLTMTLRQLLQTAGYDAAAYASHSFRRGAATTAAAAGLPVWLIQTLGRWASDCYRRYIDCPEETLLSVPSQLTSVRSASTEGRC